MNCLEDLPEIASRQLAGLDATPVILAKAKLRAAEMNQPRVQARGWQPAVAVCAALAVCVGAALWVANGDRSAHVGTPKTSVLDSHSAGEEASVTAEPRKAADVPVGSLSMSVGKRTGITLLFAEEKENSFPLMMLDGATYRMLTSPSGISNALLGDSLGTVTEFNLEPALGSSGVVSNIVSQGETVYAISGMDGALVSAMVDGSMRVFQRVSYAGTAIIGSETLGDTLCDASEVAWMELDGVGTISDTEDAQVLMQTLLDNADYENTGMSGKGSLRIGLSNGLTLQLLVGDDTVSACGTWSCPDFFEAFHEAIGA
ncbi:MAG: hypothetical protein RSG96_02000 [Clostridia bacterium]